MGEIKMEKIREILMETWSGVGNPHSGKNWVRFIKSSMQTLPLVFLITMLAGKRKDSSFCLIPDVWINGEILQRSGKTMKDVIKDGDHIKFNAVHVDTSNSWNLFYLATAVIVNKSERGVREEQMPGRAVAKESSSEVASAKVTTFKTVADKMTKKPPPVDPNQAEREEIMRKRKEEIEKRRALAKKRKEEERKRLEIERD